MGHINRAGIGDTFSGGVWVCTVLGLGVAGCG